MNSNSSLVCAPNGDTVFGPQVEPCLRDFDFTLQFENVILSAVPSAVFLCIASLRIYVLRNGRKQVVGGSAFQISKLLVIALFAGLQISLLALWCLANVERTPTAIAAASLAVADSVTFCILSYAEHGRNLRPSAVLGAYLFFSLLFDIVRIRTLWLIGKDTTVARLFTTSVVLKAVILFLEAKEKREYLRPEDRAKGPEELSSIFNQSIFYWLNQLISSGYSKVLSIQDLYPLDAKLEARYLGSKFSNVWDTSSRYSKYQLLRDIFIAFKWEILAPVPPRLALLGFTIAQPILLNRFLLFLQDQVENVNIGYGLIAAFGIVFFGMAIAQGFHYHKHYRFVTMVRGALVTAIYQKTTEISLVALDNSAAVTLMSTDVERIISGFRNLHEVWANILQVGFSIWILEREVGVACIGPVGLCLASFVGTMYIGGTVGKRQGFWMENLQKRIGITSTMLSAMKGVKMAGLTDRLITIIQKLRLDEVAAAMQFRMTLVYSVFMSFLPEYTSPILTFGIFAAVGKGTLGTATMFTSITLISLITSPLGQVFQQIPTMMGAIQCLKRIQTFLLTESKSDHRLMIQSQQEDVPSGHHSDIELQALNPSLPKNFSHEMHDVNAVVIRSGTFGWKAEEPILSDISLSMQTTHLTLVIGPVACGKSTLLKALLGETPSSQGFVYVSSTEIAFCDQTPWLINGTIQRNILGFANFEVDWYNSVIQACGLEEDLATLQNGDQSLIGSKGITLSGGQKQRVALARAVYSRKRIAIFDDVFAGMDAATEDLVFTRLLGPDGLLRKSATTVIIATHAVNLLPSADYIIALGTHGQILEQGTFQQLNTTPNGYVKSFSVQQVKRTSGILDTPGKLTIAPKTISSLVDAMDEKKRQLGDFAVYVFYFKAIGAMTAILFFTYSLIASFFLAFSSVWLKWWSDSNTTHPNEKLGMYLGVYSAIQLLSMIFLTILIWHTIIPLNSKSGIKLHWITLQAVMAAPMSLFSTVDTGILVNRFSQDMQLIDGDLPMAALNLVANFFDAIAQAILIASASFYVATIYPFIITICYFLQKYYLRTSRQLRFMDLEAKSPLYTQFIESLSGLATIRAFGWQHDERELNLQLLDTSQQPFYLLFMIQRWLTLVLDMICLVLALVVTGIAVKLRNVVSPGFTGVALVNIMTFNRTIQSVITHWTLVETSIGAVSRVKTISENTKPEALPTEILLPPENWPMRGHIEFRNVSASYTNVNTPALNSLSLSIKPGEKLGICGRSGSGKSSLILTLFRMIELNSGTMIIDDVDISTIPRQDIRFRLNAISQDPYFISGTIRLNLDPYCASNDEIMLAALRKVQLYDAIIAAGGLDANLDVDSLSHGQRQLFCLARAILRKHKIVVLDEATSSVDRKTDELMQRIVREEFAGCTILAVAHRLETILDFNRIAVLDRGKLVECDSPSNLLAGPSAFKDLYDIYSSSKDNGA